MLRYLLDVNLPYRLKVWQSPEFLHQRDVDDTMPDADIWEFARLRDLTIVTKDSDFSDRILVKQPPPRVIHLRVGNMKFQQMDDFIAHNWAVIRSLSETHKLVSVYLDRIEVVA